MTGNLGLTPDYNKQTKMTNKSNEQKIIEYLNLVCRSSTTEISSGTKLPFYVTKYVLEKMEKEKLIVKEKTNSFTYWRLKK